MISYLLIGMLAGSPTYPETAVVEAFRKVCMTHQTEEAMLAAAVAEGWMRVTPQAGTHFANTVQTQKDWAREAGVASRTTTFDRTIDGVTLSLLIDRTTPFKHWAHRVDCGVFDFNANQRLSDSAVASIRAEPPKNFHTSERIYFREWETADTKKAIRIGYVPPSSPLTKQFGIIGSTLQASYNSESE